MTTVSSPSVVKLRDEFSSAVLYVMLYCVILPLGAFGGRHVIVIVSWSTTVAVTSSTVPGTKQSKAMITIVSSHDLVV